MDIALGVVSATGENILCNAVTKEKIEKLESIETNVEIESFYSYTG